MISHEALHNGIRSQRFGYKNQTDRVELWKQQGSTKRVEIRRRDFHGDDYARAVLRQTGMADEEIEKFIAEHRQEVN
jgi:hypothetical protein